MKVFVKDNMKGVLMFFSAVLWLVGVMVGVTFYGVTRINEENTEKNLRSLRSRYLPIPSKTMDKISLLVRMGKNLDQKRKASEKYQLNSNQK